MSFDSGNRITPHSVSEEGLRQHLAEKDAAYTRAYKQRLLRIPLPLPEGDGELVIPVTTSAASFDQIILILETYKEVLRDGE